MKWVIDPEPDNTCYGKYEMAELPEYIPPDDATVVDDLSEYSVTSWRYEDL